MIAPRRERLGYSLLEALVSLLVAGVLTIGLAAVLAMTGRLAIRNADVAEAAASERTVAAVLGAELRSLTAADVSAGDDSIRLRAFRGGGAVCGRDRDELVIRYSGYRLPEEDKDSALLIDELGEHVADVLAARAADCDGAPGLALRLATLADSSRVPRYALVFETGAYSIAGAAFRYRRGAAGRQPLTAENLAQGGSGLRLVQAPGPAAAALVRLRSASEPRRSPERSWLVHMPQGGAWP